MQPSGLTRSHLQPGFITFLEPLVASGTVKRWKGTYCELDAQTGKISKSELPGGSLRSFVASPDMSSACEVLLKGITQMYQSQVAGISMGSDGWMLTSAKNEYLGSFDWLCVTSHTMGHSRWTSIFGSEPPLMSVLGSADGDAEIADIVSPLEHVKSLPVMICMVAFRTDDAAAHGSTLLVLL